MGKRGGGGASKKPPLNTLTASNKSFALSAKGGNHNPRSLLRLEHLQNLASWATEEASIPSLAAFFGRQFASSAEALGVPLDPSALFQCQRCGTFLRPGFNCTTQIEKNQSKARRRHKRFSTSTKNNVVYKCHHCLHINLKRGTPKGHMKEICPPKPKPQAKPTKSVLQKSANLEKGTSSKGEIVKIDGPALPAISLGTSMTNNPANPFPRIKTDEIYKIAETALPAISVDTSITDSPATPFPRVKTDEIIKIDETALPAISMSASITSSPATPLPSGRFSLLDATKKKRNRSAKKPEQSEADSAAMDAENTVSTSSKRKRKSWTSLKEIVEKRAQ